MTLSNWISLLCLAIALAILWEFRGVLLLVFMAVVLAIALNSMVRWFHQRWQLSRGRAIAVTLVLLILGGGLATALILPPFVQQILELGDLIPKGLAAAGTWGHNPVTNGW